MTDDPISPLQKQIPDSLYQNLCSCAMHHGNRLIWYQKLGHTLSEIWKHMTQSFIYTVFIVYSSVKNLCGIPYSFVVVYNNTVK